MKILLWIANWYLWVGLVGAVCTVAIKFEKKLPKRLHTFLFTVSLFITLATPLLGLLKKDIDDQWKVQIQREIQATKPKPLRDRLIACLDAIDPIIVKRLKIGQSRFEGDLLQRQFDDLQKLAAEPDALLFISFHAGRMISGGITNISGVGLQGPTASATFDLKRALIEK